MGTIEIILAIITLISAPVSSWLTGVLLRRKYNAEVEQLRAQVESAKAGTTGVELDNVKKAMLILMEQVVEPLKKELNAIRKEMARLRRAVEKINTCPHAADCPVSRELRLLEESERPRGPTA